MISLFQQYQFRKKVSENPKILIDKQLYFAYNVDGSEIQRELIKHFHILTISENNDLVRMSDHRLCFIGTILNLCLPTSFEEFL